VAEEHGGLREWGTWLARKAVSTHDTMAAPSSLEARPTRNDRLLAVAEPSHCYGERGRRRYAGQR
jgi:hypothetical protein